MSARAVEIANQQRPGRSRTASTELAQNPHHDQGGRGLDLPEVLPAETLRVPAISTGPARIVQGA